MRPENPTLASKKVYYRKHEQFEIKTTPETLEQDIEELLLIANDHDLDVTENDIEKIDKNGTTYLIINIATEVNGTGYNPLTCPDVVPVESVMKTLEPKEKRN